jgi:DNA-binding NarL/FixJ family response regulator
LAPARPALFVLDKLVPTHDATLTIRNMVNALMPQAATPVVSRRGFRNLMGTSVSIVEKTVAMRRMFAKTIDSAPGYCCYAEYPSAREAVAAIRVNPPDVVLVDNDLYGFSGIDCVRNLKAELPAVKFIMLAAVCKRDDIYAALQAGATGYLIKSEAQALLIDAIRQVRAGGTAFSAKVVRQMVRFFLASEMQSKRSKPGIELLRAREREVLDLLAAGKHYKEIASTLFISIDTVRSHVRHIYAKLDIHSRGEATAQFFGRRTAS